MATDDDVLKLLMSLDRRLALLTATQERDLRAALVSDILTTAAKIAMFDAINGERGGAELAKVAGLSARSGQLFVAELLDLGLVRQVKGTSGGAVIVERDDAGILAWYLQRGG